MKVGFPASLMVVGMGLASCATPPAEPQTSSKESALTGTNVSQVWDPDKMDYNSIWPTGMGIDSTYVLFKKGYPPAGGLPGTFFAFVVWNTTTVGHIYEVHFGADGQDFRNKVAGVVATRTAGSPDKSGGSSGSGDGGDVIPRPHPSGHPNEYIFLMDELLSVLDTGVAIDDAVRNTFFSYTPPVTP